MAKYFQSKLLQSLPRVAHVFTGQAAGDFAATFSPPSELNRREEELLQDLGLKDLFRLTQVHGQQIVRLEGQPCEKPLADGWFTTQREQALAILTADCVPILLAAEDASVVAAVHAGWRGTAEKITSLLVKRLLRELAIPPASLVVALGPAIGTCCFTVQTDVYEQLVNSYGIGDWAQKSAPHQYQVDLLALNRLALLEAGVLAPNIEVLRLCTFCTKSLTSEQYDFFSYRREGKLTGRQIALIGLRSA